MPRPQLYPVKKVVGFDQEMLDAIRRLVELGLKAKAK